MEGQGGQGREEGEGYVEVVKAESLQGGKEREVSGRRDGNKGSEKGESGQGGKGGRAGG